MAEINNQNLNVALVQSQNIPSEGPKAIPLLIDFTSDSSQVLDLQNLQSRGYFSMCQTLFIDLSDTDSTLTITMNGSGQKIIATGRTQGYYNILAPNPLRLQFDCASGQPEAVWLINVPIPGVVWQATNGV